MEEWRAIPGVDGYEVSSLGRVRSLDRYLPSGHPSGGLRFHAGRILSATAIGSDGTGYLGVTVRGLPGKSKVHRLVAAAFLGLDLKSDLEVDHLNENKGDNRVENLEVVTHAENLARYSARRTHCNKGHELTAENTYRNARGHRRCRECMRMHDKARNKDRSARRTERRRNDPEYREAENARRREKWKERKAA